MRQAVALLDRVRAEDHAGLARLLRWREAVVEGVIGQSPEGWYYEADGRHLLVAGDPSYFSPSNIMAPALGLVTAWANERLVRGTTLALGKDSASGQPFLKVRMGTLLTAAWLQLAQNVIEPSEARRCKV